MVSTTPWRPYSCSRFMDSGGIRHMKWLLILFVFSMIGQLCTIGKRDTQNRIDKEEKEERNDL